MREYSVTIRGLLSGYGKGKEDWAMNKEGWRTDITEYHIRKIIETGTLGMELVSVEVTELGGTVVEVGS